MSDEPSRLDVFLSYSSEDRQLANRLAAALQDLGVDVWYDAELKVGEPWERQITRRLLAADAVLVLVTPSSVESHWVTREWSLAMSRSQLVVPVVAGGGFEILQGPLANFQGIKYDPSNRQSLIDLVGRLRADRAEIKEPEDGWLQHSDRSGGPSIPPEEIARVVEMTIRQTMQQFTAIRPPQLPQSDDLAFLITAFSADMEPIADAVKAAASEVGLIAKRVKDVPGDYKITDQVMRMIEEARLVVADLTHERPNVYFELGYARGLGKRIVTIIRESSIAHFDVKDWTYISYSDSRPLEAELRARFAYELGMDRE